ncbi:SLC13 family permease [Pedobacter alpinus]|uniref:SLC13 family permease n=1 Tax=Pedobacter alpinus TaxID=1590643 RepID=A0ABW5TP21_9SPHI
MNWKRINLLIGPLLFALVMFLPIGGLSTEGKSVMACTLWVAFWWITEAVELPVASILPIIIFPLSGGLKLDEITSSYGHPLIYLFMGGFIIGLAIQKWNLHQRIAFNIIEIVGTSEKRVILGFMLATAFLSMWISNTATAVMMLPIGLSVVDHFGDRKPFSKNLMLGIAYAASIGGVATLIGTPPNIILAGIVKESLGMEISFFQWMIFATPFSIILLLLTWIYLTSYKIEVQPNGSDFKMAKLPKMSIQEKRVSIVFALIAFMWLTRSFIWEPIFPGLDDTIIAIIGAVLMFLIPAGEGKGNLMDWESARKLPWDVLLIFGAGLAIAKGFAETDLTTWLAGYFIQLEFLPAFAILILVITVINFLTEITSNTATASLILPVLVTLSVSLGVETLPLLAGAAMAASCAFMLPVATPPNAIVFSSGKITIKEMVQTGFLLNVISIVLTFCFVNWVWALVF